MTAIPQVLDALVAVLKAALPGVSVFDGPAAEYAGTEGASVGASTEDVAVEFDLPAAGLVSTGERDSITCMVWSGSGGTVFKPHRDRCNEMLRAVTQAIEADDTLGGVVSTSGVEGGIFAQQQTGRGVLVVAELRVTTTQF
jgi:hypothetical protein